VADNRKVVLVAGVHSVIGRAGFHGCIDTEDMVRSFFASLRTRKVIPA
jgi:hypothetical protein